MKRHNHTLSGTSFARFDYGYDNVNRRTYEQRDSAKGDVYGYDAVDQVASVNYDATNPTSGTSGADRTVGYTYDATGNRTAVNDSVNGNASYTANNLNQYTSIGGASYGYDGNGNLNLGANGGLYSYDAQNRLITANSSGITGGNTDLIAYDSKNRVVERTVNGTSTYYIYDGWDLIEERDSSGNVLATYVHGVRQDELLSRTSPAGTIYYHHNALGSVTDLTNASGVVVEKYQYDAYGKPSITDGSGNPLTATAYGNRFLFTGREYLAELGLYDYRNRVYSPDLGKFLQTDPERFSGKDINIYRYCGNSPTNFKDAMGTCDDDDDDTSDDDNNDTPTHTLTSNDPTGAYNSNGERVYDGTVAIDDDGTGPTHDDPNHQDLTNSYTDSNGHVTNGANGGTPPNADVDAYGVAPPGSGYGPGDTVTYTLDNGNSITVPIMDSGNTGEHGEMSVAAAQQLGLDVQDHSSEGNPKVESGPQVTQNGSDANIHVSVTYHHGGA